MDTGCASHNVEICHAVCVCVMHNVSTKLCLSVSNIDAVCIVE